MTYEDLMQSSGWVKDLSSSYFETLGAKVLVFKLDKADTKLNPIYNEEIDGRKYLRPFEIKSIYRTNPFDFSFDNTLPSETEGSLMFYFNFDVMAKTIETLKGATSQLKITPNDSGWSIWKNNNTLFVFNEKYNMNPLAFDLKNQCSTVSELAQALINTNFFVCQHDGDDYCECIPNFKETPMPYSMLLKTFNGEFKKVESVIEQGDLIYITTINALYEVTSAYPVNNTIYRYINWQCNAQRTFAYVEYEKLRTYGYGFDVEDVSVSKPSNNVAIATDTTEYRIASQEEIQNIIDSYK